VPCRRCRGSRILVVLPRAGDHSTAHAFTPRPSADRLRYSPPHGPAGTGPLSAIASSFGAPLVAALRQNPSHGRAATLINGGHPPLPCSRLELTYFHQLPVLPITDPVPALVVAWTVLCMIASAALRTQDRQERAATEPVSAIRPFWVTVLVRP
jgi:hypothetical protein